MLPSSSHFFPILPSQSLLSTKTPSRLFNFGLPFSLMLVVTGIHGPRHGKTLEFQVAVIAEEVIAAHRLGPYRRRPVAPPDARAITFWTSLRNHSYYKGNSRITSRSNVSGSYLSPRLCDRQRRLPLPHRPVEYRTMRLDRDSAPVYCCL